MKNHATPRHGIERLPFATILFGAILLCAISIPAVAQLAIVSSEVRPDREFPALLPHIIDGYDLKHGMGAPKPYSAFVSGGGVIAITVRNATPTPVTIEKVLLDGIDLLKQIVPKGRENQDIRAAHYLLNDPETTPPEIKERLEALGQPQWVQVRPNPIPAGGFAEATVRFRRMPRIDTVELALEGAGSPRAATRVSPGKPSPLAIASVCFSDSIDRAYVYLRNRDGADFELQSVSLDGVAIELPKDAPRRSAHAFLPLELPLAPRWEHGSFHCISATTASGETASTVLRARDAFFALGMWGYRNHGNTEMERARDTCAAFRDHGFNTHMGMGGGAVADVEAQTMLDEMGLRLMKRDPMTRDAGWRGLYARFLMDEPDAHEDAIKDLPPERRLGSYAQGLIERQRDWTEADPRTLDLLNVDLTYKPENWLTYGRLPDILAADPYYQMRLLDVYTKHPGWLSRDCTPYYVFAIAEVVRWAAEPRPAHILLNSVSFREGDRVFRFGTPEEKRVEFYYALAAGAKGISYWWFTPYGECYGCGSDEPAAKAMMAEMKRLNIEARSLEPLLSRAHPAADSGVVLDPFASAAPAWLMTRSLFAGSDTMLVVLVNRDHSSDRVGTMFEPIQRAIVRLEPPAWLKPTEAFRVTREGVIPVTLVEKDAKLVAEFENLQLTEILVATRDPNLRATVERQWRETSERLAASKP